MAVKKGRDKNKTKRDVREAWCCEPVWSPDEVLVFFYLNHDENFARQFGEALGYKYVGMWGDHKEVYMFKTPEGKSKDASREFESYSRFIEWAEPRDLKMAARCDSLEEAIEKLKRVNYCANDRSYEEQIDEIFKALSRPKYG